MNTDDLMQLSLDMVGYDRVPGDCAIFVPGRGIGRVLIGIDIGPAELLLARQLGMDCVIAHHPGGFVPDRASVYRRHVLQMVQFGVPTEEAEAIVTARLPQFTAATSSDNYDRTPSVARLLGIPFLNIHNPWDEMGRRRLQEWVDAAQDRDPGITVGGLIAVLSEKPEFRLAETRIEVRAGSAETPAGRTVVSHGAYTNGGYAVASAYFRHGAGTVMTIHFPAEDGQRIAREGLGNLVVLGHIVSDSVGITPFIGELRARGVEVVCVSGVLDAGIPPPAGE